MLLCFYYLSVRTANIAADIKEIRATVAQQPQERHLFDTNDTLWRLESSDSAVVCQEGHTRKIVTLYYSK